MFSMIIAQFFAASLVALRRPALYEAGGEKAQPIFVDCAFGANRY